MTKGNSWNTQDHEVTGTLEAFGISTTAASSNPFVLPRFKTERRRNEFINYYLYNFNISSSFSFSWNFVFIQLIWCF